MAADVAQRLIRRYLKDLREASRGLRRAERRELIAQIEELIRSALPAQPSESEVREVLQRLGEPEEIVAEQYGSRSQRSGMGAQAVSAIVLLLIGGFLGGVGWIAGVVLLWTSHAWTLRDKILGTLVLPGGLFGSPIVVTKFLSGGTSECYGGVLRQGGKTVRTFERCTPGPSTAHVVLDVALLVLVVGAPMATAVFLSRHARPLAA